MKRRSVTTSSLSKKQKHICSHGRRLAYGGCLKMLGKSSQSPSSGSHQHQQLRLVQPQQAKLYLVTDQEACGGNRMLLPTWKQTDAAPDEPPWRCKPALPVRSPLHDDHSLNDEAFGESAIECPITKPAFAFPCDAARFVEFKAWAEELNRREGNSGEVVLQWPPLRFRSPAALPDTDWRFWRQNEGRVFVCDQCGDVVRFSKVSAGTGCRILGEFAGNYEDSSWKELDYSLRWNAWNMGLIDARWFCQRVCGQHPTDAEKNRHLDGNIPEGLESSIEDDWRKFVNCLMDVNELAQLAAEVSEKEAEAKETLEQARSMVRMTNFVALDHCDDIALLRLQRHSFTKAAELIARMASTIADLGSKVLSHTSAACGQNAIVLHEYSNQLRYVHHVLLTFLKNMGGSRTGYGS